MNILKATTLENCSSHEDNITLFKKKYNCEPHFIARAPGRVNIIGEHIDYCGYSVLPMALEQSIYMYVAAIDEPKIKLINVNSCYEDFEASTDDFKQMQTDAGTIPKWYMYFACGYRGIIEKWAQNSNKGMLILVDGTVPPSAGLSSSSATVVCSAIVTLRVNNLECCKTEIADVCAKSEYYIGTLGGGMDQAISVLAEKSFLKFVEFNPLKATNVACPENACFVVAHCGVTMNKAATFHFNKRVAECKLANYILAKLLKFDNWKEIENFRCLQIQMEKDEPKEMIDTVLEHLKMDGYEIQEMETILECEISLLLKPALYDAIKYEKNFQLRNRAMHVFTEAQRVLDFRNFSQSNAVKLETLGKLMVASHFSCKDLYEVSVSELDNLVDTCLKLGAFGARLTGAGWGGCVVALVDRNNCEDFLRHLKNEIHDDAKPCFLTQPANGAEIFNLSVPDFNFMRTFVNNTTSPIMY